jgi:hypothetical protein
VVDQIWKEKLKKVKCQIYGAEVFSREIYYWLKICEDRYFEKAYPVKTYNPIGCLCCKNFESNWS